jgi:hypothetical protein
MKIIYRGPRDSINVPPHGEHRKGESKEYPDAFGKELITSSKKQKFEVVGNRSSFPKEAIPQSGRGKGGGRKG